MRAMCVAALLMLGPSMDSSSSQSRATQGAGQGHTAWVSETIMHIQAVKPGMTRADLLKVFTTEGGLSTGLWQRYVYRGCPYVKVDVECEAVGRPPRDASGRVTLAKSDADTIKTISKPFLEWSIMD
jgi:hypothetical protein